MLKVMSVLVLLCLIFTLVQAEVISVKEDKTGNITVVKQETLNFTRAKLEDNLAKLKQSLQDMAMLYNQKKANIEAEIKEVEKVLAGKSGKKK